MDSIDKIDKKIIMALTENCRYSNSLIAKQLKISEQLVKYRIERMEKEGIISKYITAVTRNAVGTLRYYTLFIKIKKTRPKEKQAILDFLIKSPYAIRVMECEGLWDISVEVTAAVLAEVKDMLDEVQKMGGIYIEDLKVLNMYLSRFLKRLPFSDINEDSNFAYFKLKKDISFQKELLSAKKIMFYGVARLDKVDIQILSKIRGNARIPMHQLAIDSGYNVQTIKTHITEMVKRGIIKHFTAQIDYSRLGFRRCLILLSALTNEAKREEIIAYVHQNFPTAHSVVGYFDYWNIGFLVYFKNIQEVDTITDNITQAFQDIISDYNKLIYLNKLKDESYSADTGKMYKEAINYLEAK